MFFELISKWISVQFLERIFTFDLVQVSDLNSPAPVIFVLLSLGDQTTSSSFIYLLVCLDQYSIFYF